MQVKPPMLIESRIFRCKHRMHNREILELLGEWHVRTIVACKAANFCTVGIIDARRYRELLGAQVGCIERCKPQPCRKPTRAHIKCVETVCDDGRDKAVEYNSCRRAGEMECYEYKQACTEYERNTNAYLSR